MEDGDGDVQSLEDSRVKKIVGCPSIQVTETVLLQPETEDETSQPLASLEVNKDTTDTISKTISESAPTVDVDVPKVKVNGDVNDCHEINDLSDRDTTAERNDSETKGVPLVECSQAGTVRSDLLMAGSKRKRKISDKNVLIDDISVFEDNVEFKGFKKRILAQASVIDDSSDETLSVNPEPSISNEKDVDSVKQILLDNSKKKDVQPSTPQAEYAQYLGLQPTVKFKCYKCGETGFPSMLRLQEHQNTCLNNMKTQSGSKPSSTNIANEPSPSTNFCITRKVYLCSACGTYYENWNLFLHMRQVHKRHICLLCLSMFVQAEKLSSHLTSKHGIVEAMYASREHLFSECSGSCFLMCVTCEKVFTEGEDFSGHDCKEILGNIDNPCSRCNIRGSHLPSCRQAATFSSFQGRTASRLKFIRSQESGSKVDSRNVVPVSPVSQPNNKKKQTNSGPTDRVTNIEMSDAEDDYAICNAASFCHVNIEETPEKQANTQQDLTCVSLKPNPLSEAVCMLTSSDEAEATDTGAGCVDKNNVTSPTEPVSLADDSTTPLADSRLTRNDNDDIKIEEIISDICLAAANDLTNCIGGTSPNTVTSETNLPNMHAAVEENSIVTEPLITDSNTHTAQAKTAMSSSVSLQTIGSLESELGVSSQTPTKLSEVAVRHIVDDVNILDNDKKSSEILQTYKNDISISPTLNLEDKSSILPSINNIDATYACEQGQLEDNKKENGESVKNPSTVDITNINDNSSQKSVAEPTPVLKRSSRRRVNIRSWAPKPRRRKPQQPKPEVKTPAKTPLTLKFIKTSSTENPNYRTAIDGNLLEFDNSDYDATVPDPASSPESSGKPEEPFLDPVEEALRAKVAEEQAFLESIQVAGEDVPAVDLYFEDKIEFLSTQALLQECVKSVCLNCVYCSHAKKIAVNGKQLALHLLAEHRFAPHYKKESSLIDHLTVDTPILPPENGDVTADDVTLKDNDLSLRASDELSKELVTILKKAVLDLHSVFLNTETYDSSDRTFMRPYDRTYECFQCNFLTTLHKDLYVHNRKMHQKTILLCIMCKSNFYSYSELLCHLCPGIYNSDNEIKFRCCVCIVDSLPSAFRLMVHLRKRHNCCDVCLELTEDQQKLSNHVWKHKLHHLCYRCGIAYRNKPDITKHLFWKHGTESVLCKKCLQKKWPHVYHFCVPPNAFICEECNASFSRAVSLKVHKRLHSGDLLYGCDKCEERFVSKKLLAKHQDTHREVPVTDVQDTKQESEPSKVDVSQPVTALEEPATIDAVAAGDLIAEKERESDSVIENTLKETPVDKNTKKQSTKKSKAKVVDVYDLPPLNLSSESDDTDDEKHEKSQIPDKSVLLEAVDELLPPENTKPEVDAVIVEEENHQPVQTVDGVWDNFQNYKANLERRESQSNENISAASNAFSILPSPLCSMDPAEAVERVMRDHDYCGDGESKQLEATQVPGEQCQPSLAGTGDESKQSQAISLNSSLDHDYCWNQSDPQIKSEVPTEEMKPGANLEQTPSSIQSIETPTKKKQKVSRRNKRTMSSSSSDSSSSGSSSCSCKTNCSCSTSSSSSSGSSSDSSASDSSTSEGRRLQIARREQRREARRKKLKESTSEKTNDVKVQETELPVVAEPELVEEPIHESDLETEETETDEDFYDQHPQLLANKLLAEKRNQLLLLAAVAPGDHIMTPPESLPPPSPEPNIVKKKNKSKKRKRRQHELERRNNSKIKHNTSTGYYVERSSPPETLQPPIIYPPVQNAQSQSYQSPLQRTLEQVTPASATFSAESGSETDSKRLSKRRRLPKKFYGDSSDEDSSTQPKWTLNVPPMSIGSPAQCVPLSPVYKPPALPAAPVQARVPPIIIVPAPADPDDNDDENQAESESEREEVKKYSSDSSSNSEPETSDTQGSHRSFLPAHPDHAPTGQRSDNLYCYCQCPYDEVSEMIACDGKECAIEWFHFECVGIMVPPRGKWFCPDCRKASTSKTL